MTKPRRGLPTLAYESHAVWRDIGNQRHRLFLNRKFEGPGGGIITFLLCNPSTANEEFNDATTLRCERFALSWGYTEIQFVNALSACSRHFHLIEGPPNHPENDAFIKMACDGCDIIVCGWSLHIESLPRRRELHQLLQFYRLYAFKLTKSGAPAHPVYLSSETIPVPFFLDSATADLLDGSE